MQGTIDLILMPSGLIAPRTYAEASPELRAKVCNGCGPADWRARFVPSHLLGVDGTPACNIHDWMYHEGQDKALADVILLANLCLLIQFAKAKASGLRKVLDVTAHGAQLDEAFTFYRAVEALGDSCFNT